MARQFGITLDGKGRKDVELDETLGGNRTGPHRTVKPEYAPGTSIGRYVVLGEIGSGAMGIVLAAFDPELNRKVALKILVPVERRGKLPPAARLLREAQAIARLSHPNVVNVYDVGRHGDAVFLAMEFVEGVPLGTWLEESSRSLEAVLEVFSHAGRGLAAAHRAGLVHRDFKPDNVLVTPEGRVRVLDFGLARADPTRYTGSHDSLRASTSGSYASLSASSSLAPSGEIDLLEAPEPGAPLPRSWSDSDVLNTSLTRDDAVVGTPRYMAPEQHGGAGADARSDQYSFCVALYQALYRQDPFDAPTLQQLVELKHAGRVASVPQTAAVPLWVEEVVLRGLSVEPANRWPSMDALVDALERDPSASRRRWLGAIAGVVVLGGVMAAVGYQQGSEERPCQGSEEHLDEVWNPERRAQVAGSILSTGLSFSLHTRAEVERALDEYADTWAEAHRDACEATRLRGEQSDEMLDLRMACLDRRRDAMRAFVDVVSVADAGVVERAVQAVGQLPDIEPCGDIDRLAAGVALPDDDDTRRLVETIEAQLAQAGVLQSAGKTAEAFEIAKEAREQAEAVGYQPLIAQALARVGGLLEAKGDYAEAEKVLRTSMLTALRTGDDEQAAAAATTLTSVVGDRLARYDEGLLYGEQALALLDRTHIEGLPRARLNNALGNVYYRKGDLREARSRYTEALAARQDIGGEEDPTLGLELVNLGNVQLAEEDYERALATFRRSQEIVEASLGAEHPNVLFAVVSIGVVFQEQGRYAEARKQFEQALAPMARSLGEGHPFVGTAALNLGNALRELGEHEAALEQLSRAETIFREAIGPDHPNVGAIHFSRGLLYAAQERWAEARAELSTALRIRRAAHGKVHEDVAATVLELAKIDGAEGDAEAAVAGTREAIALFEGAGGSPEQRATGHAALADALWVSGDRAAGRREAELALGLLLDVGPHGADARDEVRAWLNEHPQRDVDTGPDEDSEPDPPQP